MKINAAVVYEKNGPFVIKEVDLAEPKGNELIVKIAGCGVCHTDEVVRAGMFDIPFPVILGHEGSGIVEKIGPNVKNLKPGDAVILAPYSCGKCEYCLSGHPAECIHMYSGNFLGHYSDGKTRHIDSDGSSISSLFCQSAFASHAITNERNAIKIDATGIDLAILGPLSCGIQPGAGAVLNIIKPEPGTSFAVFGCGAVGLAAVMAAKLAGCTVVIGIDVNNGRLETAKELGCTHVINGKDITDLTAEIMGISGGINSALDTTGIPAIINAGIDALKPFGAMAFCAAMKQKTFEVSLSIRTDSKKLIGVTEGDSNYPLFLPKLLEYYKGGVLPFDKLTKYYRIDEIEKAFEDALSGETIKPIIRL